MIVEKLLDFFFAIASLLFDWFMPDRMDWTVNTSAWAYVSDILNMVAYMLPINTITAIIALIVDIAIVRILIAIIRTVWGFIPFV